MIWQPFLVAIQFLTRLPVRCDWSAPAAGASLLFCPLVGLLLGVPLALISVMFAGGELLAAALVVTAWVLLTGALPLDGLADSADAWVGGHGDRDKTLAIMKDPHVGPVGVVALVLVLGLKWSALTELMAAGQWLPLVVAPVLGRTAVLALFYTTPYAREQGLGAALVEHLPRREVARVLLLAVALAALVGGRAGILALLVAIAVFAVLRLMMLSRLGGTTGDTAGATIELVEVAVLAAYAV